MHAHLTDQPISITKKLFKEIFDLHFNALCGFGKKYVSDDSIEDIVQEVFISFWHKKADFNNVIAAKSYLYTAVRNKCLNAIRDDIARQKKLEDSVQSEIEFEQYVIEEETFNQLYIEIKSLPAASQQIMLLALNGLKNQEIAEELGISLNTVKTQKKIAYSKLKQRMSKVMYSLLLSL